MIQSCNKQDSYHKELILINIFISINLFFKFLTDKFSTPSSKVSKKEDKLKWKGKKDKNQEPEPETPVNLYLLLSDMESILSHQNQSILSLIPQQKL